MCQLDKLTVQIDTLSKYANVLKVIIVSSFVAGIWITTLQLKVNDLSDKLERSSQTEKIVEEWKQKTSADMAVSVRDISEQKEDIREIKQDVKELLKKVGAQ